VFATGKNVLRVNAFFGKKKEKEVSTTTPSKYTKIYTPPQILD
jgi:hypothetical protein